MSSAGQAGASGRHSIEVHRQRDSGVVAHQDDHIGDALMPEMVAKSSMTPILERIEETSAAPPGSRSPASPEDLRWEYTDVS